MSLSDTIEKLERDLAVAKAARAVEVSKNRPTAAGQLAVIKGKIDELVKEAQQIARDADLVFYYSNGYEEFSWQNKEDWSYSSQDC